MGRKRNPYLPLFTRDIMSSPRCRALSREAAGVYLFLLCRLNEPPTPGAYRLSDWEEHANWSRSKTTRCLSEPDKYSRLQYFAKMLSVNDLPWRERDILESLQELYNRGIITVVGDALIQPRMFADNGFTLDAEGTILDDPHSGSMALRGDDTALKTADKNTDFLSADKGTKKVHKKVPKKVHEKAPVSHARASRAESESENNNIVDNEKKEKKNKKETLNGKKRPTVADRSALPLATSKNPPTLEEIQAYFDERAQQGKPFVYVTAEGFYDACCQSGWTLKDGKPIRDWRARCRTFENYRKERGDRPIGSKSAPRPGQAVPLTEVKPDKYKEKW